MSTDGTDPSLDFAHTLADLLTAIGDTRRLLPMPVVKKLRRVRVLSERNEWIAWEVYDSSNGEGDLGMWCGMLPDVWTYDARPDEVRDEIARMRQMIGGRA